MLQWPGIRPSRSNIAFGVILGIALSWLAVVLWPGRAPLWMLVVLIVFVAIGGPASMIGFDFARTFNPQHVIGTATGIVNVGGFLAALVSVYVIGWLMDFQQKAAGPGAELYNLDAFRWAMSFQFLVISSVSSACSSPGARRAGTWRCAGKPCPAVRQTGVPGK